MNKRAYQLCKIYNIACYIIDTCCAENVKWGNYLFVLQNNVPIQPKTEDGKIILEGMTNTYKQYTLIS